MKTADLITSFLSNEMTADQERQFLLSVAASDSMRLSLKSHVMLDRIAANQLQRAEVPVSVREAIFAQMSASMAEPAPSTPAAERPMHRPGAQGTRGFLRKFGSQAVVMALTAGGFVAGYLTGSDQPQTAQAPAQQVQSAPAVTAEPPAGLSVKTGEAPAAPQTGLAAESSAPAEGSNLVTYSQPSVREQSRGNLRNGRSSAGTSVQLKERSAPAPDLSNPLEPAEGINKPAASTAAAGGVVASPDTLNNGGTQPSASVQVSIRKSDANSSASQDPKGD